MRGYNQLTLEQRYQIQDLLRWKYTTKLITIAVRLDVHVSTISRELRRNRSKRGYRALHAHRLALARRLGKSKTRLSPEQWRRVRHLLKLDWSPEQISLWFKANRKTSISHESIYQYIIRNKHNGGSLYKYLRQQKQRRKRYGTYDRRICIKNRVSIEERPASVEKRWRFGDWEIDTMHGKNQRRPMVTVVDRKSRLTLICMVESKNAQLLAQAVIQLLWPYRDRVKTITSDNGVEFACHEKIVKLLDTKFYFAHPHASWERGSNENTNGLLRQYFPKKSDFTQITQSQLDHAMERLNNRPRKCLGMKTPNQRFFKQYQPFALSN